MFAARSQCSLDSSTIRTCAGNDLLRKWQSSVLLFCGLFDLTLKTLKTLRRSFFATRTQLFCDIQMSGPSRLSNRCVLRNRGFRRWWMNLQPQVSIWRSVRRSVPLNCYFEKCKFTSQKPVKVEALPRSAEVYSSENAEKWESGIEFIATDHLLLPDFAVSGSACKSRKIRCSSGTTGF